MKNALLNEGFITLADLYLSYRKAKSEAYYNAMHPTALAFAEYEANLKDNLDRLYEKLSSGKDWFNKPNFLGGYLYIPKSLDDSSWNNLEDLHYRSIDPILDWKQKFQENNKKKLDPKYRLIITPTIDYHIISALWILKVGHLFDERLDQNLSYGNRLRRRGNGQINEDSIGLFTPYFSAYRQWREKGLNSMRDMVEEGRNVTAITMDLAGFYHNTSPNFLLKPSFLSKLGVELDQSQKAFTSQMVKSINTWYQNTPDFSARPEGALPVGLSASKIISNVLLFELDAVINQELLPVYYGRYVDDIFLVVKSPQRIITGSDFIEYLSSKADCLKIDRVKGQPPGLTVRLPYANDSLLKFTPTKQKIFSISSDHGVDLIEQISSQIRAQSSEYRLLPAIPDTAAKMADKTLLASNDASLIADALRKADVISVKRLGLSLLIRDIEAYSKDLRREEWVDLRKEFYLLVFRHLITPKQLFELYAYFPRIINLMISNYDFNEAKAFIVKVHEVLSLVGSTTNLSKGNKLKLDACREYFGKLILQAILKASTTRGFIEWIRIKTVILELSFLTVDTSKYNNVANIRKKSNLLLLSDLGSRPYKDYWYYSQKTNFKKSVVPKQLAILKVLRLGKIRKFRRAASLKRPHWLALTFPTRPLTIQEIALIVPSVVENGSLFEQYIHALRGAGANTSKKLIKEFNVEDSSNYYHIPHYNKKSVSIALTNYLVEDEYYDKAVSGRPDRSLARYENLNSVVNNILSNSYGVDYVVFPEVAIPRRWAIAIATKLASQGISLICGVEPHPHNGCDKVYRNDCLLSLVTNWPGYQSSLVFIQPKLLPAHIETEYFRDSGKELFVPDGSITDKLPIYNHNGFHFGVLICSDLTTPQNRVHFQGKVDAMFILEFNPDIKTFNFLVESAAHDINTFVIQVNNRCYGDSRIRAPYREEYKRDSIRIKGGKQDYSVIGDIDFLQLRKFQNIATNVGEFGDKEQAKVLKEFKPLPIGFKLSKYRRI